MILRYANDGQKYSPDDFKGFNIDYQKDCTRIIDDDEQDNNTQPVCLNFVGFLTNDNNDSIVVFPKGFHVTDLNSDANLLFQVLQKNQSTNETLYLGEREGYVSSYPFKSFFEVYSYYEKFGLYFDDKTITKVNSGDYISWKDTIRLSNKVFLNNKLVVFPLYYKKKYLFSTFVTNCMVFVINYTIEKYGVFLSQQPVAIEIDYSYFVEEQKQIVYLLNEIIQKTFNENILRLLYALVEFFSNLNIGGSQYLKHHSFATIWERMVMGYLNKYFCGLDGSKIVVDESLTVPSNTFQKVSFYPDFENPNRMIQPDYYGSIGNTQLICDAKYYTTIGGLNYKQLAYYFLLAHKESETGDIAFEKTVSSLILPSDQRKTATHFKLNPKYNKEFSDMLILEEYFDIKKIMIDYVKD